MATFQYRGFDAAGRPTRGLLEAGSTKAARERLLAQGILAEKISVTSRGNRFPSQARATVFRELASLVEAGIPLVKAMEILIDTPELAQSRVPIARVRDAIKEGSSLPDAFGAAGSVTEFEKAMLQAAQQSGSAGPVLERLADFLEERDEMRERVRSALIYPAIVTAMGIGVAGIMLGVLLPRMQAFLSSADVGLPLLTRAMLAAGRWAKIWGLLAAVAAAGLVLACRSRLRSDDTLRKRWDRRLLSVPGVGRGYHLLVNMRFSRTLCLLLQGGVPLIDAFVLAGQATGSVWVRGLVASEANRVRHGDRLSDAVARIPPLAGALPGWIRVGEASGGMIGLMGTAAKRYEAQWDRFVSRSLSVMEPVLIVGIGGFVLLVTLAVLLPVLDMTRSVSP